MISYDFTERGEKDFLNLPKNVQNKILEKLDFYLKSANPLAFSRRLRGISPPAYRFRIDDYRIIFEWKGSSILILRVGHRKDIYR